MIFWRGEGFSKMLLINMVKMLKNFCIFKIIICWTFFYFTCFFFFIFNICKKEKAFSHNPLCHEGAQYYFSVLPLEGHIAPLTGALHIISFVSCEIRRLSLPIIEKLYLNILLFTLLLFL